ncbi:hypothetical protein G647_06827 [Cladophialophora carrionii CBS 160.54]|uniref:Uncharacterized protein n=1 Tax=Cladophialophora carrionii CBS 160.54 TaxID=1279043 RepID=V9D7V4_9EURO|nr:uncharacterized protein G647_06827 [Cladophialophora carrionii CBS 160.54]ETI22751.1 hypothetical protein G647_06827 [Cladophialophora carrionii CBS 160.54]
MPLPEKSTLRRNEIDTSIPTDSPPSYENTILPASNPWTDTPTLSAQTPTHQLQHQHQPQIQPQPPPPPAPVPSQNPLSALSRLTTVPFSKYRVRDSKLSDDQTALTTTSPDLTSSSSNATTAAQVQRNVTKFIAEQASLPPKPIMIIRGTHLGSGTQHGSTIVDFELKFNLTSLLDLGVDVNGRVNSNPCSNGIDTGPVDEHANTHTSSTGGRSVVAPWKLKVKRYQPGSTNGSPKQLSREEKDMAPLELWAKKFCEDKAENRSFTLTRQCPSLPTALLEGHARNLLASTKYRGTLTVTFPTHHSSVTILRKSSNWFTNMLRLYPTKKYEVVSVEWPIIGVTNANAGLPSKGKASGARPALHRNDTNVSVISESELHPEAEPPSSSASSTSSHNQSGSGSTTDTAAAVAQAWWREWHVAVRNAVLSGRKGWVTVEDWIEAKTGVREKERLKEWGVDYE